MISTICCRRAEQADQSGAGKLTAKKINRYHRKYRNGVTENMKTVSQKSPGRPAKGRDPLVPVRLPRQLLEAVERWAGQFDGMSRSSAIRALIGPLA
jgi:hypothetical protein